MSKDKEWDKTYDWFWEGNVQNRIKEYMKRKEGFKIVHVSNPMTKEQGPDILAKRKIDNGSLERRQVSVKGYPSDKYVEGKKKGKKKRTRPPIQARHWFAEALFELILAKSEDQNLQIALGFPNFKVYLNLLNKIKWFRNKIGLFCYIVTEKGQVKLIKPDESI
ncbi:MAG: hypothetical protein QXG36_02860 [Nitrososphaeria archaeon]